MAFGTVFFLVAARMLQIVLTGEAHQRRHRRLSGPAARPWEWDYPWRPERMAPDYGGNTGGTILGRVAFLALIGLFNIAWGSPSWLLRGIVLFFDLLALLVLYDSLAALLQAARFRRPWVRWKTFPAFLGETLEAAVAFPRPPRPSGPVKATLRCVRDEWVESREVGSGNGETRRELEPFAIYKQSREVPLPGAPGAPLASLDVAFEVPPDLLPNHLAEQEAVYWQLVLEVPVTGPDLAAIFLAPVYRR